MAASNKRAAGQCGCACGNIFCGCANIPPVLHLTIPTNYLPSGSTLSTHTDTLTFTSAFGTPTWVGTCIWGTFGVLFRWVRFSLKCVNPATNGFLIQSQGAGTEISMASALAHCAATTSISGSVNDSPSAVATLCGSSFAWTVTETRGTWGLTS